MFYLHQLGLLVHQGMRNQEDKQAVTLYLDLLEVGSFVAKHDPS